MASKLSGIELTRYDDLFKTDAEREADRQERIQLVPAAEVFPYSRQPYTIDRPTPERSLQRVPKEELDDIARRITAATGIAVQVSA